MRDVNPVHIPILIPRKPEAIPSDRRCKKPGCNGEYHRIYGAISCFKCGWHPHSGRAKVPTDAEVNREIYDTNWLDSQINTGRYLVPRAPKRDTWNPDELECTKCRIIKPVEEFYRHQTRPTGRQSQCKVCLQAKQREYRAANRRRDLSGYAETDPKRCNKCQITKTRADFYTNPSMIDGKTYYCKSCQSAMTKKKQAQT